MDAESIQEVLNIEDNFYPVRSKMSHKIFTFLFPLMEELGKNHQWWKFMMIYQNYLTLSKESLYPMPEPILEIVAHYLNDDDIVSFNTIESQYYEAIYKSLLDQTKYNQLTIKLINSFHQYQISNENIYNTLNYSRNKLMAQAITANNPEIIQYLHQTYKILPIFKNLTEHFLPRSFIERINEDTMAYLLDYNKENRPLLTEIATNNSDLGVLRLVMPYADIIPVYHHRSYDHDKLEFLLKYDIKDKVKDTMGLKFVFITRYLSQYSDDMKLFLIYLFDPNENKNIAKLGLSPDDQEKARTIRKFTSSLSEVTDNINKCLSVMKDKTLSSIVNCLYQQKTKELDEAARKVIGEGKNLIGEIQIKDNYQDQQGNLLKQVGVTTETLTLLKQKDSARIQLFLNSIKKVYPNPLIQIGETENGGRVWVGLSGEYIFNVTIGIYLVRLRVKSGSVLILTKYDNIGLETVEEGEMLVFGEM